MALSKAGLIDEFMASGCGGRYGRQIPFAYLLNIKEEFLAKFATRARGCAENALDKIFG